MSCCVRSRIDGVRGDAMIEMRRAQLSFGDGLIAEEVSDLREDWIQHADQVLAERGDRGGGIRSAGQAPPQEPPPRPAGNSGRSSPAPADPQAHPQPELRGTGARGARQSGVPRVHPCGQREGALSLSEPSTEVIRKGKAAKPNEFGKMVKL